MEPGFKEVYNQLKQLEQTNTNQVYVPSCKNYINYKTLTMSDQKRIIKTALDSSSTNISFNITLNEILLNLNNDTQVLTIDKPAILVQLRANNIDTNLNIENDKQVNLNKIISKYETLTEQNNIELESRVEYEGIKVRLKIPSLQNDSKFLLECKKHVLDAVNVDAVGNNISEMYIYELAKYIHSVQYTSLTESTSSQVMSNVMFDNIPALDCLKIVELLPVKLNNKIVEFIKKTREFEALFVEVDGETIPIDTSLFTID